MLALMTEQPVPGVDEVMAYADDANPFVFYLIAKNPRWVIQPDGSPAIQFIKYRAPVPREGGKMGGGFLIGDVAFSVPANVVQKAKDALQEVVNAKFPRMNPKPAVEIREVQFTRGSSSLQILDGGDQNAAMVQRVQNPGAPSLFGDLVTAFTAEFSPEGATLVEQALQSKGPLINVIYDLYTPVKLPPMKMHVWLRASKFMDFFQKVDINDGWYSDHSYQETIRQQFVNNECSSVDIDPGAVTDQKIVNSLRDSGFQTLDDAIKRMIVGDVADVSADDRKVPDGIKHLTRSISEGKIVNFDRWFTEGMVIEWDPKPQGPLPGLNTLTGKDGKPLQLKDFLKEVDLNDAFFQTINIPVKANADFANLNIFSIDGQIAYKEGSTSTSMPFSLTSPSDVVKFASFTENNKRSYSYSYKVNFKGEDKAFESGTILSKGDEPLTINVGDTGVLHATVQAGDINFDEVNQALVTVHYEDPSNNVDPIEWELTLDKDHKVQTVQKVIFAARTQPFKYSVKYDMKTGQTYRQDWKTNPAPQIYVESAFAARKTIHLRAIGDLTADVGAIFLDAKYVDETNTYTQSTSVALSKSNPFFDWTFPVINDSTGTVTYSGSIQFQDGTLQTIADTTASKDTILVGRAKDDSEFLSVTLQPDLLDFDKLKLVKVVLHYVDSDHDIDSTKDFIITKKTTTAPTWSLRLQDKTKKSYQYQANFFLVDGTSRSVGPITSSESILLLETPAATAATPGA